MELYHLHLLGNHDNMYKPNSEIFINEKMFNNRLYDRAMSLDISLMSMDYQNIIKDLDKSIKVGEKIHAPFLLAIINEYGTPEEKMQILIDMQRKLHNIQIAKRELSMEQYRKDNDIDKPSRMHSLFACKEDSVEYWKSLIIDGDGIYKVIVDKDLKVKIEKSR